VRSAAASSGPVIAGITTSVISRSGWAPAATWVTAVSASVATVIS
jgi:hypothetical protein